MIDQILNTSILVQRKIKCNSVKVSNVVNQWKCMAIFFSEKMSNFANTLDLIHIKVALLVNFST